SLVAGLEPGARLDDVIVRSGERVISMVGVGDESNVLYVGIVAERMVNLGQMLVRGKACAEAIKALSGADAPHPPHTRTAGARPTRDPRPAHRLRRRGNPAPAGTGVPAPPHHRAGRAGCRGQIHPAPAHRRPEPPDAVVLA